jgi:hypothetical protein
MVAGAAARRGSVPEPLVDEVRLAVGEAVARAVLRHQRAGVDADVVVTMLDDPESFEVLIDDRSPERLPEADGGMSVAGAAQLAAAGSGPHRPRARRRGGDVAGEGLEQVRPAAAPRGPGRSNLGHAVDSGHPSRTGVRLAAGRHLSRLALVADRAGVPT